MPFPTIHFISDPMSRIKLKDAFRSSLFQNVLETQDISLFGLSKKLNCGYSAIKKWRKGKCLLPEDVLNLLLSFSTYTHIDAENNTETVFLDNWGEQLGGATFYKKYKHQIKLKLAHARSFIKQKTLIPTRIDNDIWELFGVLLGDGCLSKYFSEYEHRWVYEVILTGNMNDDLNYYTLRIIPILKEKFNLSGCYHIRAEDHVICIRIKNKRVFDFFKELGMPIGKKKNKIRITKEMFKSTASAKAAILRGLLDTDGHIFARKDEGYKYPYLEISSGTHRFLEDIKQLILEFGLPAYLHDTNVLIRGGKNLRLWMEKIGSSHPVHINRYNTWLLEGKLLPKRALSSVQ